jgi:hypothetical protein
MSNEFPFRKRPLSWQESRMCHAYQELEKSSSELICLMLDNIEAKLTKCKCNSRCNCGSQVLEDMLNELRVVQRKMQIMADVLHKQRDLPEAVTDDEERKP